MLLANEASRCCKPGALVGVDISAPEAHADRPGERVAPLGVSRGHPPGRVLQLFV